MTDPDPCDLSIEPTRETYDQFQEAYAYFNRRCGKACRGSYCDRECAQRMKAIRLHPSSTGKEGGQETGDSVGHYIVPGGPFEVAAHELLMRGFAITWTEKPPPEAADPPIEGAEG